ncbi:NAD-dependent epimerase/dehydratase family protein [Streptomyces litchfieldiae]|uniref:NAD-dependent epimerase/dehydratase family protein n=1 Tax=Streptomyces litchfieldiae TaxID=3075543 RepID=A0ABU2MWV2_9ACTN|nr:NAD-dependent epimerase/dehydratase family protein [Streptomyces sp. DSM 44938]MDT0345852.1 NAD-dependent epimerase/dehydratase family protein [Streptomyces sp. DSM 44938]
MRILVMGGTWFLGRAVAEQAVARGWKVSTFSRGRSGNDVPGVVPVRGDRTVTADLARLAEAGPWDAVIDTSSADFAPRTVLAGARALAPVVGRYVYLSTVNAYRGWPNEPLSEASELLDAPADAGEEFGRTGSPAAYYGTQKAGSERAIEETFGAGRVVLLRPGVILGPGEYVGRLPWWLRRAHRGGTVLAPGDPTRTIQPVDVRDVAAFALDRATAGDGGAYNVAAPIGRETMGGFLTACLEVTGARGELRWMPDEVLVEHGVRQWTELPLWRTSPGAWAVDSTKATAAGLRCRPLAETVADTWAWLRDGGMPVEHPRWAEHGITPERETAILSALGQ